MRITDFGCKGYKSFKQGIQIKIKPLTIIIGKNNSGKSVLLRLPRLILHALAEESNTSFPVDVGDIKFGEVFLDLVSGRLPHGTVSFSARLEDKNEPFEVEADILHTQDTFSEDIGTSGQAMVSRLEVKSSEALSMRWNKNSTSHPEYGTNGHVVFSGLLPQDDNQWAFLKKWREGAKQIEQNITHLGPLRKEIPPAVRWSAKRGMGIDGDTCLLWLADDNELLDATSQWIHDHLDGWKLHLIKQGKNLECEISRGNSTVNLAYAGQGLHQVLPIVVQQLAQQKTSVPPRMMLVEQPELHLHGAAEAPLGDLFVDTALKNDGTSVIVETHSENLLLRVRRRIAEGYISSEHVSIYWVEEGDDGYSTSKHINIKANGEVDWWPEGVFSEGYEEVRAIRRAERKLEK